jgi:hypothetical protein
MTNFVLRRSSPAQDIEMVKTIMKQQQQWTPYNVFFHCVHWTLIAIQYGMNTTGFGPEEITIDDPEVLEGIAKELGPGKHTIGDIVDYVRGLRLIPRDKEHMPAGWPPGYYWPLIVLPLP